MGILEDVILGAKSAATTVGHKAGEIVDVSRLRLTAAEINKEIAKRYEALGRVVYDSRKDNTNIESLVSECVRSIDALYSRLDAVNARIAQLRNQRTCPTCNSVNDNSAVYCNRCGARIPQQEKAEQNAAPEDN